MSWRFAGTYFDRIFTMAVTQSITLAANGSAGDIPGGQSDVRLMTLANGNVASVANTGGGNGVVAVHTAAGTLVDSLAISGFNLDIAQLTNGNLVVTSHTDTQASYTIVSANAGSVVAATTTLKTSTGLADTNTSDAVVTAMSNGGFAIVSQDEAAGDEDVEIRFYNAAGVRQGNPITFAGTFNEETRPDVLGLPNGNVVVVWEREAAAGSDLWQVIFDAAGNEVFNDAVIVTAGTSNLYPRLSLTEDGYGLAYERDGNIYMQPFSLSGAAQGQVAVAATGVGEVTPDIANIADGLMTTAYRVGSAGIEIKLFDPFDVGGTLTGPAQLSLNGSGALATLPAVTYLGGNLLRVDYADIPSGTGDIISGRYLITRTFTSNGASDTMAAGELAESFVGGGGTDLVSYSGSAAAVIIDLDAGTASGGDATGDSYGGIEGLIGSGLGDRLLGDAGNNRLLGGAGTDTILGRDGADYIDGGSGADQMNGGLGNDFYIVDNAGDAISGEIAFSSGGGIDTVRTFINNYVQPNNIELVRLGNITDTSNLSATGNDAPGTLVGNAGNNTLTGRGGNDQLNGNGGDDVIIGNTGRDTVVGGAGADRFVYSSVSESRTGAAARDVVNGFTHGLDTIDLSAVDAVSTSFGDDAFTFINGARFSGTAGELRTQSLGGPNAILIEADVNGDGVANMQIFVNLTTFMEASDFIL